MLNKVPVVQRTAVGPGSLHILPPKKMSSPRVWGLFSSSALPNKALDCQPNLPNLTQAVDVQRNQQKVQKQDRDQTLREPVGDEGKIACQAHQSEGHHAAHQKGQQNQRRGRIANQVGMGLNGGCNQVMNRLLIGARPTALW